MNCLEKLNCVPVVGNGDGKEGSGGRPGIQGDVIMSNGENK